MPGRFVEGSPDDLDDARKRWIASCKYKRDKQIFNLLEVRPSTNPAPLGLPVCLHLPTSSNCLSGVSPASAPPQKFLRLAACIGVCALRSCVPASAPSQTTLACQPPAGNFMARDKVYARANGVGVELGACRRGSRGSIC